jgi:signal transduction histidine kinase
MLEPGANDGHVPAPDAAGDHRLIDTAVVEAEAARLQDVLAGLSVMDAPDPPAALATIAAATAEALGVRRVSIWRHDKARAAITCALLWQDRAIGTDPLVITDASAPKYWQALLRERTVAAADAVRDPATQDFLADDLLPMGIGALMDTGVRARRAGGLARIRLAIARQDEFSLHAHDFGALARGFDPLAASIAGQRVRIETAFVDDALPVRVDQAFVARVLLNLVTNAVQAMPDGGRLTIATDLVTRTDGEPAGVLPTGRYARLRVTDTGVGMDREHLIRIFDPFFTTKGHDGTGLGLAVVYGGMRRHEGHVLVERAPGCGSTFHACFPLHEA